MHNTAAVLENDTQKILWDFDIQTDHIISARRQPYSNQQQKKENLQNCRLCYPGWHRLKLIEFQKKDKYLDLSRELKKNMEYEGDDHIIRDWCIRFSN